ncbi:RhoGAP-domain-containing protein, partial [Rozella allomycis CSF55]
MSWMELRDDILCIYASDSSVPSFHKQHLQSIKNQSFTLKNIFKLIKHSRNAQPKPYSKEPLKYVIPLKDCSLSSSANTNRPYTVCLTTTQNFEIYISFESDISISDWSLMISNSIHNDKTQSRYLTLHSERILESKYKTIFKRKSKSHKEVYREHIFGTSLDEYREKYHRPYPPFIKACIRYIEKRGINREGLYRISGHRSHIMRLRELIEIAENFNFDVQDTFYSVDEACSILKMYFRELKEPLLLFKNYEYLMSIGGIPCELNSIEIRDNTFRQVAALQEVVKDLPAANARLLYILMKHLNYVQSRQNENKMTAKNLAMIFGPSLIGSIVDASGRTDDQMLK